MGNSSSTFPIRPEPSQHLKSLSVVIPALNEEANIRNTLNSLKHHGLDAEPEVIVVDGASTDNTPRVVKHLLPPGYGLMIEKELSRRKAPIWGCFEGIKTDISGWSMRVIEWGVRARTRWLHLPYGDQALFIDRNTLATMQGFKTYPLLEDVDMVRRLGSITAPTIIPEAVTTSGRRWSKFGIWQTMLLNQCVMVGYQLGIDVSTLSKLYESTGVRRSES